MKTIKVFAIAAISLVMGLTGCTKENTTPSKDKFSVTISFKSAVTTRATGGKATAGTEVGITDGWLCFVTSGNTITEVYTIKKTGTTTGNDILNSDLGTTPLTLTDIPGSSTKACMIINPGSLTTAPTVGANMATYLENNMDVKDQGTYTGVTAVGEGNLTPTAEDDKKAVTIPLKTKVSRIQIENLKFDNTITAGSVEGIFINGFYTEMKLDGTAGSLSSSTDKDLYGAGKGIFTSQLSGYVYDAFTTAITANTVAPATGNVWGYNLFTSATPQIIIKMSGVTANGVVLSDPQFVTVNGFKNTSTSAPVTTLEGGMIYTIKAGTLIIKPEHFGPTPGVTPIDVAVTVETVSWKETEVTPNL